jgi:hypothetical protein
VNINSDPHNCGLCGHPVSLVWSIIVITSLTADISSAHRAFPASMASVHNMAWHFLGIQNQDRDSYVYNYLHIYIVV